MTAPTTGTPPMRANLVTGGASAAELAAYDAGYARARLEAGLFRSRIGNEREAAGQCRACGRDLETPE